MSDLTAVSLFAGIEGIGLALSRAGIDVKAAVEIDPACRGVISLHFPETALFNDVTEVTGDQLRAAGFVPGRGILAGGFPCQDLSVAGRRAGLGGARSGLFWHIVRLAREMSPRWLLLENVPGLLSAVCACDGDGTCTVNGRAVRCGRQDKRAFIPGAAHTPDGGACRGGCMERHGGAMGTVLGALGQLGYGLAYRVLDAQFFGVPQRRPRVFIAGCLGDRGAPAEVLLEPEGGAGHPPARRAPRPRAAAAAARGAGHAGTVGALGTVPAGGGWRLGADEAAAGQLVAADPLTTRPYADASATERQLITTLQGGGRRGHRIDAESAAGGHLIPMETAYTLTARDAKGPDSDMTQGFVAVAATLTAGLAASPGVNPPGRRKEDDVNLVAAPMAFNPWTGGSKDHLGYSETPTAISCSQPTGVQTAAAVRRLTPLERERLQGFPDNWTRWRLEDGHLVEQSDSARDRQTGNAVAVPVAEWIGGRIVAAEAAVAVAKGEVA